MYQEYNMVKKKENIFILFSVISKCFDAICLKTNVSYKKGFKRNFRLE